VNNWVLADFGRRVEVMAPAAAIAKGATSLEGEKYPDEVRVVSFGEVSTELCGGTHVEHTSYVGLFRIQSQESVASGIRRVTALTRHAAVEFSLEQGRTLGSVSAVVHSSPRDVVAAVERLAASAGGRRGSGGRAGGDVDATALEERTLADFDVTLGPVGGEASTLRPAAASAAKSSGRLAVVWTAAEAGEPATLAVAVPDRYQGDLDASRLVRGLLGPLGGSG
jgi:alanyl-tRNA synthetase